MLRIHLDAGHYSYDMIDHLAKIKINAIIIEFEVKLRYRKAPVVCASDAVSIDDVAVGGILQKGDHFFNDFFFDFVRVVVSNRMLL